MTAGWLIVPWVLAALGALLVWIVVVGVVVTYVEDRRHQPHPRPRR